jgi:pyridoxal phosphate-dependent aminotransferase EpsN
MNPPDFDKISLSGPHLTGKETALLFKTNPAEWTALVERFEETLSKTTGATFALATHSGTAALELALRTLGIGPHHTVVCPALTFVATANAISKVSATPYFVGCDAETWCLSPEMLDRALQNCLKWGRALPKAIIAVDLYGMPARWSELQTVANQYGIPLIADAAESVGSTLNGQACGSLADLNVLSLLTNNKKLFEKARVLANQGRENFPPYHVVVERGGSYRLNPVAAGYGLAQLPLLSKRVARRRAIFAHYYAALHNLPGLTFQPERAGAVSNRWLTALTIDRAETGISRDELARTLNAANIETRPVFYPVSSEPAYWNHPKQDVQLARQLSETGLCLPSGSNLTDAQIGRVIEVIQKTLTR